MWFPSWMLECTAACQCKYRCTCAARGIRMQRHLAAKHAELNCLKSWIVSPGHSPDGLAQHGQHQAHLPHLLHSQVSAGTTRRRARAFSATRLGQGLGSQGCGAPGTGAAQRGGGGVPQVRVGGWGLRIVGWVRWWAGGGWVDGWVHGWVRGSVLRPEESKMGEGVVHKPSMPSMS